MGKPNVSKIVPMAPPPVRSDASDVSQVAEIKKGKRKKRKSRSDTFLPESFNAGYSANNTFLSGR